MQLQEAFTLSVQAAEPISLGKSPFGLRRVIGVTSGRIEGRALRGSVLAGRGGDWMLTTTDGYGHPEVLHTVETDDDALILLRGSGLMEFNAVVETAITADSGTDFADHYIRAVFTLETGDSRYAWLKRTLFVGEGRYRPQHTIEYKVFRVM
jgi:hypothetical protein